MTWKFADPSPAIDDWIEREQPSDELRDNVLGRLLDLTDDPLPPSAGKIMESAYLADLSTNPLVVGLYGLDPKQRLIFLKAIDTLSDD